MSSAEPYVLKDTVQTSSYSQTSPHHSLSSEIKGQLTRTWKLRPCDVRLFCMNNRNRWNLGSCQVIFSLIRAAVHPQRMRVNSCPHSFCETVTHTDFYHYLWICLTASFNHSHANGRIEYQLQKTSTDQPKLLLWPWLYMLYMHSWSFQKNSLFLPFS